jgi:hypothetical protein
MEPVCASEFGVTGQYSSLFMQLYLLRATPRNLCRPTPFALCPILDARQLVTALASPCRAASTHPIWLRLLMQNRTQTKLTVAKWKLRMARWWDAVCGSRSKKWRDEIMSKTPNIDHEYHAGSDKLKITIEGYSLKKKSRAAIMKDVMHAVERRPDRLIADNKKKSKKGSGKRIPGHQKSPKTFEQVGD